MIIWVCSQKCWLLPPSCFSWGKIVAPAKFPFAIPEKGLTLQAFQRVTVRVRNCNNLQILWRRHNRWGVLEFEAACLRFKLENISYTLSISSFQIQVFHFGVLSPLSVTIHKPLVNFQNFKFQLSPLQLSSSFELICICLYRDLGDTTYILQISSSF